MFFLESANFQKRGKIVEVSDLLFCAGCTIQVKVLCPIISIEEDNWSIVDINP